MKGVEESLQTIIFVIGSIVAVSLLITIVLTFTETNFSNELEIEGNKQDSIQELRDCIYKCWDKNKGRIESSICFKIFVNFTGTITEDEVITGIDTSKIEEENIKIEIIEGPAYLLVKYERGKVIIENR